MKWAISDLDIFYLSYDEPWADKFYADLCAKIPKKVKRIHGVKGFDNAHRKAAEQSETPRFVTVDGDSMVTGSLLFQKVDDEDQKDLVFSFKAKNVVNGLEYGNGGVKVWPKNLVLQVPTHENANSYKGMTDFCWTYRYLQVDHLGSEVHFNLTPYHAWRAGYREGMKMGFHEGRKLPTWKEAEEVLHRPNLSRLKIWASVGADVANGWWAIYGTRAGFYDLWFHGRDFSVINDYDYFKNLWDVQYHHHDPELAGMDVGRRIEKNLGVVFANLDPVQSAWFKTVFINPERSGIMMPDMDPVEFSDD
jgi:hypothetical protein